MTAGKTLSGGYSKMTIHQAGIRLLPFEHGRVGGYLSCKVEGAEFDDGLKGLERYVDHVNEKHPEYVSKEGREKWFEGRIVNVGRDKDPFIQQERGRGMRWEVIWNAYLAEEFGY